MEEQPGQTIGSDGCDLSGDEMAIYLDRTVAWHGTGLHKLAKGVGVVLDLAPDRLGQKRASSCGPTHQTRPEGECSSTRFQR